MIEAIVLGAIVGLLAVAGIFGWVRVFEEMRENEKWRALVWEMNPAVKGYVTADGVRYILEARAGKTTGLDLHPFDPDA